MHMYMSQYEMPIKQTLNLTVANSGIVANAGGTWKAQKTHVKDKFITLLFFVADVVR